MDSTRRGFLRSAGLTGIGAGVTAGVAAGGSSQAAAGVSAGSASRASIGEPASGAAGSIPFHGPHQAGIATPAQEHLQFPALDMVRGSLADLRDFLRSWSAAAALMAAAHC